MNGLIFIDIALLVVVLISCAIGIFRGFFREALSLASWVIAIWASWVLGRTVAGGIEGWIDDPVFRLWAARAMLFVVVLLLGGLLSRLIQIVVDSTGLTGTDRAIGVVFGFGRGVILVGLMVVTLELAGFNESAWWPESKLIPYATPIADMIRNAAEDGFEYLDDIELPDAV